VITEPYLDVHVREFAPAEPSRDMPAGKIQMLALVVMNQSIERPVVMRFESVAVLLYVTREQAHDDGAKSDRREVVRRDTRILAGMCAGLERMGKEIETDLGQEGPLTRYLVELLSLFVQ